MSETNQQKFAAEILSKLHCPLRWPHGVKTKFIYGQTKEPKRLLI